METSKIELTILIPIYNEEDSIKDFLPNILSFIKLHNFNLIIVNDGSTDSTGKLLNNFANEKSMTIITHKINKGYGAAIKSGIKEVKTKYLITIDGDGQHILEDILKLNSVYIEKNADMVVGSRKKLKPYSLYRHFGKFLIRTLAKLLMPLKIHDINSGMKIYSTELAKKYISLCPDTMAYSDIITLIFINQKHLVIEEDINIKERVKGTSTINTKTAFETILELINIIMLFNPLRIFLPIAIGLFVLGIIWGLPIVLAGRGVSTGAMLAVFSSLLLFLLGLLAEQLAAIRKRDL